MEGGTYSRTNLEGLVATTGNRAKQMTKHARAPRLQPAKTMMRSHLLTVDRRQLSSASKGQNVTRRREELLMCDPETGQPKAARGHRTGLLQGNRDRGGKKPPRLKRMGWNKEKSLTHRQTSLLPPLADSGPVREPLGPR